MGAGSLSVSLEVCFGAVLLLGRGVFSCLQRPPDLSRKHDEEYGCRSHGMAY
jgi:hypothetical protein